MTPVLQTRFGKDGNCFAACLASLFEVPIEEVQHCAHTEPNAFENLDAYLAERGLFHIEIKIDGQPITFSRPPIGANVILTVYRHHLGRLHAVVGRIDPGDHPDEMKLEIIHDPQQRDTRAYTISAIHFFCKLHK